jgi:hypothetical protein
MIDGSLFLSNVSSRFFPVLVSIFYVPRVRPLVKSPSLLCLAFFAKRDTTVWPFQTCQRTLRAFASRFATVATCSPQRRRVEISF